MKIVGMIPARLGSTRIKKKNLSSILKYFVATQGAFFVVNLSCYVIKKAQHIVLDFF